MGYNPVGFPLVSTYMNGGLSSAPAACMAVIETAGLAEVGAMVAALAAVGATVATLAAVAVGGGLWGQRFGGCGHSELRGGCMPWTIQIRSGLAAGN